MSAYICSPEHFGVLAAYAVENDCVIYPWTLVRGHQHQGARIANAQNVARLLARENIRSVKHRYGDDDNLPGPCLSPADIEEAAALYAAHFLANPQRLTPVQVLSLCAGYGYQACECDDWRTTDAELQIEWIEGNAHRSLPGWDNADWEYSKLVPEIEALYEKEN